MNQSLAHIHPVDREAPTDHPALLDESVDDEIVGRSTALREIMRQVEAVAATDATVLVCGESGTGKELIARAIHRRSARRRDVLVKVNCAALPSALLESELFGHERGAFTGALGRRVGRFELADDGTLFLDEIGEMPLDVQPKLLRVLQEREFERLGSSQTLRSHARVVAATNRDLTVMMSERTFREDLYYRINVFPIRVPPLRDRRGDIALLAHAFVTKLARRMNKHIRAICPATLARLESYDWPGNIRELHNVLERATILARGPVLEVAPPLALAPTSSGSKDRDDVSPPAPQSDALAQVERAHILSVLSSTKWVVGGPNGAAIRLGIKRSTLNFRMKKLGIERPRPARTRPSATSQTCNGV
jgi:transcriptional regulator with GAF, ATPase, and Fis domain